MQFLDAKEEGKDGILLAGLDSKGKMTGKRVRFDNYLYVIPSSITNRLENRMKHYGAKKVKMRFGDGAVMCYKILTEEPEKLREELKKIEQIGKDGVYEYTIPFYRKYLVENHQEYPKSIPNMMAIDIETSEGKILMISLYGKVKKVLTYGGRSSRNVENVKDEKAMLERFWEIIKEVDPNVILTYNGDLFDFPTIRKKMEIYGMKPPIRFVRRAAISAAQLDRIHIDLYQFINNVLAARMESEALDLNAVSSEILGMEKEDVIYEEISELYREDSTKLAEYCLRDSELTYKLGEKLVQQILDIADLIGQTLFDTSRMMYSQLVEWYLSRRAKELGVVIPNQPKWDEINARNKKPPYQGGFVLDPIPGVHEDISVVDFRSLYPSIIASHNISPETLNCVCCKGDKVPELGFHFCEKKRGFVSQCMDEILKERFKVKGKDKVRDNALKTIANAMYGYLGFPSSKWYSYECAAAAAAYGRFYIKKIISMLEKDFKVIYGDTDSVFVTNK